MSSPKKKKQRIATVKARQHTSEGWQSFINHLGLYDAKYEKDKYLMKEYSLTNHFLEAFELMSQVKGSTFSADSFTITLIEMNRQRNKNIQSNEQLKLFLTSFLASFQNLVTFSNELSFFTRMLDPKELENLLTGSIQFYLKVRKYITHNFVNEREAQQKALNFEQWVSVVSRFLDNKAIVTIGNQIKEKATQTNNNEKIMENSIDYFDLIILCYEEQEKRLKKKNSNQQQSDKHTDQQASQNQKNNEYNRNNQSLNDDDQEVYYEEHNKQNSRAHKIAYNITMGPPDSLKKSRDKEEDQSYIREYDDLPVEKYDKVDTQHKMIVQLNDTKHKIMEDMMRQNLVFNETLRAHEHLAINYKYLANFSQELQNQVASLVIKIRNGQSIGVQEINMLEKHSQFNEFLLEDPEITLQKTGIYEVIKKL